MSLRPRQQTQSLTLKEFVSLQSPTQPKMSEVEMIVELEKIGYTVTKRR